MLKNTDFTKYDSIAIWNQPQDGKKFDQLTDDDKVNAFKKNYQENFFDKNWLKAIRLDRVIVGQNPGDKGIETKPHTLLAFHGDKKSNDARFAAALYHTSFWGAFMTDLNHTIESDSTKVDVRTLDVENLFKRFKELGIDAHAPILAVGQKAFKAFKKYDKDNNGIVMGSDFKPRTIEGHRVTYVPHYSGSNNGGWHFNNVHQIIIDAAKNN